MKILYPIKGPFLKKKTAEKFYDCTLLRALMEKFADKRVIVAISYGASHLVPYIEPPFLP